jgi:hypothetical protein
MNAKYNFLLGSFNIIPYIQACTASIQRATNYYRGGGRNPYILAAHATGFTDWAISTSKRVNQLNANAGTVFSNAPINERFPAAVDVGWFSVSTAANITGTVQLARGINAFTRSGAGSADYAVPGTQRDITVPAGNQLYRVYGGGSLQEGRWATTTNPGNQINAISRLSLPPENTANMITTVQVTGAKAAEISVAKGIFNQPGGAAQVKWVDPYNLMYLPGRPLPVGFMPFSPPNLFSGFSDDD